MQFLRAIAIPYEPNLVLRPKVFYENKCVVVYESEDEGFYVRLSFEKLDSLKVCRGEYLPYALTNERGKGSMFIVENSTWLKERHAYEVAHYRAGYEWGNNVDDMLTEFDHYLFTFHDEFIEFLAAGIWFEQSDSAFTRESSYSRHPLSELPRDCSVEQFESYGIKCETRMSSDDQEKLYENSKLCSQPLVHFALELDGKLSVTSRFDVRTRNGRTTTALKNSLGTVIRSHDGIISIEEAKSLMDAYIFSVHNRRKGK